MKLLSTFISGILSTAVVTTECSGEWPQQVVDLRQEIKRHNLHGYLIPSEDAHLSEYVAPEYARRTFITGLHGSAGDAIVLNDEAALKTDSRYCDAIPIDVDCNWTSFCPGSQNDLANFAGEQLKTTTDPKVGADPFLFTQGGWETYRSALAKNGIELVPIEQNLVDNVWSALERPKPSEEKYFIHDLVFTGATVDEKLSAVIDKMSDKNVDYLIITRLDSIAWVLNLRGLDVPYSPVITSYLVVDKAMRAVLYPYDPSKIRAIANIDSHLCPGTGKICVTVSEAYTDISTELSKLSGKIWVPSTGTTFGVMNAIDASSEMITDPCPVEFQKSVKNKVEQAGMKRSGLYDSVAICEGLLNTETKLSRGDTLTELDVAADVARLRGEVDPDHYMGESFDCIAASGPNAANNHYSPTEATNRKLAVDEIFLLDNGGQYLDGTTDVTRTIYVGEASDEIKDGYTRVLQGNMHLSNGIFPSGTYGYQMEPFARQPLFQNHKKYGHGTGHGIGYFLLVHELPNGIGSRASSYNYAGFVAGMVESNEPGFYVSGDYGMRIEDDELVVDVGDGFIGFEKMSLVPYEPSLINFDILTNEDVSLLRRFHEKCQKTADLARNLNREKTAEWIEKRIQQVIDIDESRRQNGSSGQQTTHKIFHILSIVLFSAFVML